MQWAPTLAWLRDDPPHLVVHTGDIVEEDPDDHDDRAFARQLLDDVPAPLVCIPGNHDVGFYGDDAARPRRLAAFRATWGHDRFSIDVAGWRVVGVDAYLLGNDEHDAWLHQVTRTPKPLLIFVHQPLHGDPDDGWQMPGSAREAFAAALDGADVAVVASGHRHVAGRFGRAVWAPSLALEGGAHPATERRPGVVEHRLAPERSHDARVVRPWDDGSRASAVDHTNGSGGGTTCSPTLGVADSPVSSSKPSARAAGVASNP